MSELVLVRWQWVKNAANISTPETGDDKVVYGVHSVGLSKDVADHFNIPSTPASAALVEAIPSIERKAHERKMFSTQLGDGRQAKTVKVGSSLTGDVKDDLEDFLTCRIKSKKLYTPPGGTANSQKQRTVGIRFPLGFNLTMVSQALGSALTTNTPLHFSIDGRGGKYIIYRNSLKQPFKDLKGNLLTCGAWILQPSEEGRESNNAETGKGSTSTTQPIPLKEVP